MFDKEIYLNGKYEKSILLSNQQETSMEGSSETYTQSFSKNIDNTIWETFNNAKPEHKKKYDKNFIWWFVGFTEGDGSFVINKLNKQISFIITQKDPKVLYYLRKNLGFGKVYLCKDNYYRYIVSKKTNLLYLINIFSGKLILEKVNQCFYNWVKAFDIKINFIFKFEIINLDLKNSWFSGFIDAEGCFDSYQRSKRLNYRMRFSIKQKNEFELFKSLPYLWNLDKKQGHLYFYKDISVFTMDSLISLEYIIKYLNIFTLKSNKNIVFNKWLKLYRIIKDGSRGKSFEEIKKIALNINKFENEDKVHDLEKI